MPAIDIYLKRCTTGSKGILVWATITVLPSRYLLVLPDSKKTDMYVLWKAILERLKRMASSHLRKALKDNNIKAIARHPDKFRAFSGPSNTWCIRRIISGVKGSFHVTGAALTLLAPSKTVATIGVLVGFSWPAAECNHAVVKRYCCIEAILFPCWMRDKIYTVYRCVAGRKDVNLVEFCRPGFETFIGCYIFLYGIRLPAMLLLCQVGSPRFSGCDGHEIALAVANVGT